MKFENCKTNPADTAARLMLESVPGVRFTCHFSVIETSIFFQVQCKIMNDLTANRLCWCKNRSAILTHTVEKENCMLHRQFGRSVAAQRVEMHEQDLTGIDTSVWPGRCGLDMGSVECWDQAISLVVVQLDSMDAGNKNFELSHDVLTKITSM